VRVLFKVFFFVAVLKIIFNDRLFNCWFWFSRISFAEALGNGKSIFVVDDDSQTSSKIAGGLYNPVILKRFSEVWQAQEQLLMNDFLLC
jgi:hypothetical protein